MSKKQTSKVGVVFKTGAGRTYSLVALSKRDGRKHYRYKWHECPDSEYFFESVRELDSIDIAMLISNYISTVDKQ